MIPEQNESGHFLWVREVAHVFRERAIQHVSTNIDVGQIRQPHKRSGNRTGQKVISKVDSTQPGNFSDILRYNAAYSSAVEVYVDNSVIAVAGYAIIITAVYFSSS